MTKAPEELEEIKKSLERELDLIDILKDANLKTSPSYRFACNAGIKAERARLREWVRENTHTAYIDRITEAQVIAADGLLKELE